MHEVEETTWFGLLEILGFAPSVNCLEDTVARTSAHAEVFFDEQEPVDPTTEEAVEEMQHRDPRKRRTVVAIMDGETKFRDLQELKIGRAVGILDIWHVWPPVTRSAAARWRAHAVTW